MSTCQLAAMPSSSASIIVTVLSMTVFIRVNPASGSMTLAAVTNHYRSQ